MYDIVIRNQFDERLVAFYFNLFWHSTKHGLDWTVGLDSWTGQLDWTVGLDSWTGQLDWTIGLEFFSIKYMQFDVFEENEMIIFKLNFVFLSVKFLWPAVCISASMPAMYNVLFDN